MDNAVVNIRLPSQLYADLQTLAAEEKAKDPIDMIARLVARAREHRIRVNYPAESPTLAFRRILERATDMGIPDLSEQHDHYLYETEKR